MGAALTDPLRLFILRKSPTKSLTQTIDLTDLTKIDTHVTLAQKDTVGTASASFGSFNETEFAGNSILPDSIKGGVLSSNKVNSYFSTENKWYATPTSVLDDSVYYENTVTSGSSITITTTKWGPKETTQLAIDLLIGGALLKSAGKSAVGAFLKRLAEMGLPVLS